MKNDYSSTIKIINEVNDYWFVRTDGGKYFDTYYSKNYIAIGWNEITLKDLENEESVVKNKINRELKLDNKIQKDRSRCTEIYNKLNKFKNIKINDIIVMPSQSSNYLAFGIVQDNMADEILNSKDDCPYIKRRKIKWINQPTSFNNLDNVFYKIRKSRHSISDINQYANFVDAVMFKVFNKNGISHFVINVEKKGEINWSTLGKLLTELHQILELVNEKFQLNEQIESGSIQISLQSPGTLNLAQYGISLIILTSIIGGCRSGDVTKNFPRVKKEQIEQFKDENRVLLDSVSHSLKILEVNL